MREGTVVALLSFGGRLQECLQAADELAVRGFSTTVADARFAKPIDRDLLRRLAREHEALVLVEEASTGGFATQAFHALAEDGLLDDGLKIRSMVLPDRFIDQGAPEQLYEWAGLKAPHIVATALKALEADSNPRLAAARAAQ